MTEKQQSPTTSFRTLWFMDQYEKIKAIPEISENLSPEEIQQYLLKCYQERHISTGRLFNNTNNKIKTITQEQFINKYLNEKRILTGYACFHYDHDSSINVSAAALENLGDMRKINKKKMEAAEHGSDEYFYYRILQLTYKLLSNSFYGILGERNSIFYNPFVQNSITMSGQDLITTSIIAMEAFLSNNTPFESTSAVLTFLKNIVNEKKETLTFSTLKKVEKETLVSYLLLHSKKELNREIISAFVSSMSEEDIARAYFKNNIYEFLKLPRIKNILEEILKFNFLAESPEEGMKENLNLLTSLTMEFVLYNYLLSDRYKRAMQDKRSSIITIDTDSNFINGRKLIKAIENQQGVSGEEIHQTISNIVIFVTTEALKRTFKTITSNLGIPEKAQPIINMKQEFFYKRIMLTRNKKHYAGIITAELGKALPKPELDIKGLPILKKTVVPKVLRKHFKELVTEEILKSEKINLVKILEEYDNISKSIRDSIENGETKYLLPKSVEVIESYKAPDNIESVRGIILWNALEPKNQIIPPAKINLLKLKCNEETDERLEKLKETHPDKYNAIMSVIFNHNVSNLTNRLDISRFGMSCIAIPKNIEKIPEYLIPFIDFSAMVNTNMSASFVILESLGVYCEETVDTKYKSNILSI